MAYYLSMGGVFKLTLNPQLQGKDGSAKMLLPSMSGTPLLISTEAATKALIEPWHRCLFPLLEEWFRFQRKGKRQDPVSEISARCRDQNLKGLPI